MARSTPKRRVPKRGRIEGNEREGWFAWNERGEVFATQNYGHALSHAEGRNITWAL